MGQRFCLGAGPVLCGRDQLLLLRPGADDLCDRVRDRQIDQHPQIDLLRSGRNADKRLRRLFLAVLRTHLRRIQIDARLQLMGSLQPQFNVRAVGKLQPIDRISAIFRRSSQFRQPFCADHLVALINVDHQIFISFIRRHCKHKIQ